jgi:hypothetical protein
LLSDRYAPITSSIGFLQLPLKETAKGLARWREQHLHAAVKVTEVRGALPELFRSLEPLTGGVRPRELLVATAGDWTAYFACGVQGGDPVSTVSHLAATVQCHGLAVTCVPHTLGTSLERHGRYGAVQFEMYGPLPTDFLNYVRTVSATHDGSRWRFDANGTVQPFEQTNAYTARRVRDRFTSAMLADYCAALGVRPFDESFYLERGLLVQSPVSVPPGGKVLTLAETQEWLGIVPGVADQVPG